MAIYLIYACEQNYGGLHGMYDWDIRECDSKQEAEELGEYMSHEVMETYSCIMDSLYEQANEYIENDTIDENERNDLFDSYVEELMMENVEYRIYKLDPLHSENEYRELTQSMDWEEIVERYGVK